MRGNAYISISEILNTHNTCFSITRYQFIFIYLPIKIKTVISYRKLCFKRKFSGFLMFNVHFLASFFFSEKDEKYVIRSQKFVLYVGNIQPFKNVIIVYFETNQMIICIYLYIRNLENVFKTGTQYSFVFVLVGRGY